MNKLKLKISINAYNDLLNLLKFHDEYDCIRLSYKKGCCKSADIEITLDVKKTEDITETIDRLSIAYDKALLENVSEVTIMINNGNFVVKSDTIKTGKQEMKCSCNSSSNGKSCGGCKKSI